MKRRVSGGTRTLDLLIIVLQLRRNFLKCETQTYRGSVSVICLTQIRAIIFSATLIVIANTNREDISGLGLLFLF